MKRIFLLLFICILIAQTTWAARAKVKNLAREPYVSALVVDADTGEILFEDQAAAMVYPASVLKLMVLLVVLERVEQGALALDDMVQVTKEAARMGGSQVYLDPKEQFSVEDLLYALAVQSANDASVALATHVSTPMEGKSVMSVWIVMPCSNQRSCSSISDCSSVEAGYFTTFSSTSER